MGYFPIGPIESIQSIEGNEKNPMGNNHSDQVIIASHVKGLGQGLQNVLRY